MEFKNSWILLGLAAVAIPIIIHLLSRRRARVVEWGAMLFLLGAVAQRTRRITMEEIILLVLRCMLMAMVVLAIARPFIPKDMLVPWPLVLPLFFGATICFGISGAMWRSVRLRWTLIIVSLAMLVVGGVATASEYMHQSKLWPSEQGGRDVAIIIDGSTSMGLRTGGRSNFQSAMSEAREVIDACSPADAVSVFVAGSMPRQLLDGPSSDHQRLDVALRDASQPGGSMRILRSMDSAIQALQGGHNTARKLIIIHDGQNIGWEPSGAEAWQGAAKRLLGSSSSPRQAQIISRRLLVPGEIVNAAVAGISVSHSVVGVGRTVKFDVDLRNFGTKPVPAGKLKLFIDENIASLEQPVKELPVNAGQIVRFEHRFTRFGPQVVMARFETRSGGSAATLADLAPEDMIPDDNVAFRVVNVWKALPVLIVDGAGASGESAEGARPPQGVNDSAGGYLNVALSLAEKNAKPASDKDAEPQVRSAIVTKVVSPIDLVRLVNLEDYRVIILADVPRLTNEAANKLASYVEAGGGLIIAPGERASPGFYNGWITPAGRRICPAKLSEKRVASAMPIPLSLERFTPETLRELVRAGESDAPSVAVRSYWSLTSSDQQPLSIQGAMENDAPFLVEGKLGKGRVLLTAVGLDTRDSNLPRTNFFLPLAHELVYSLAATTESDFNVPPGGEVALPGVRNTPINLANGVSVVKIMRDARGEERFDGASMSVVADAGPSGEASRIRFIRTDEAGLYRFRLPAELAKAYAGSPAEGRGVPFVVLSAPAESNVGQTGQLSENDMKQIKSFVTGSDAEASVSPQDQFASVRFEQASNAAELRDMSAGRVPGEEMWRNLAVTALLLITGEILLTRWIARKRKSLTAETVTFGTTVEEVKSAKTRLKEMVAVKAGVASASGGSADRAQTAGER